AAVELWGMKPEIGKTRWNGAFKIFDSDGITELDMDQIPIATVLKEGRKIIVKEPLIVERPDGSRRYFLPHPEPIFNSEGKMTGASNMLIDVTEKKLAEEQMARLAAIVHYS